MMTPRSATAASLAALATLACHDTTSVALELPQLNAVNGATYPILTPGDSVALEGSGFGAAQGNSRVTFHGSHGAIDASAASWSDNQIIVTLPDGAESGNVSIAVDPGGVTLGPIPVSIRPLATFDAAAFTWTDGPALPDALRAVQLLAFTYPSDTGLTSRLQAVGGASAGAIKASSLFSDLGNSGTPAAWRSGDNPAPAGLLYAGSATATQAKARLRRHPHRDTTVEGVSYLLGGMDATGRVVPDVFGLSVWQDGDQGAWTRLVALPDPRAALTAVVAYGNIYVLGGFGPDSLALRATSVAVVDSFGAPTGWVPGPPLPEGRAFAAVVVRNHVLYLLGGEAGRINPSTPDTTGIRSDVYAIRLSARTGFFLDAGWQTLGTTLVAPRSRHAAFGLDAGILVAVGVTTGAGSESEFAALSPSGILSPFQPLLAPTIASQAGGSVSEVGSGVYLDRAGAQHVVLVGGQVVGGAPTARVWWH
jgi:hypothetical protein